MGLYGSPQIGYHGPGEPPKRKRRIPLWLWLPFAIVGGLFALLLAVTLVIAIVQVATGKVSLTPSPSSPPPQASSSPSTVATSLGSLLDVSGTGPKITGRFVAKAGWDMAWSYDCGQNAGGFSATVYEANNQISFNASGVSDFGARANGVKHYTTPGTYFLQISSSCSWHVVARAG